MEAGKLALVGLISWAASSSYTAAATEELKLKLARTQEARQQDQECCQMMLEDMKMEVNQAYQRVRELELQLRSAVSETENWKNKAEANSKALEQDRRSSAELAKVRAENQRYLGRIQTLESSQQVKGVQYKKTIQQEKSEKNGLKLEVNQADQRVKELELQLTNALSETSNWKNKAEANYNALEQLKRSSAELQGQLASENHRYLGRIHTFESSLQFTESQYKETIQKEKNEKDALKLKANQADQRVKELESQVRNALSETANWKIKAEANYSALEQLKYNSAELEGRLAMVQKNAEAHDHRRIETIQQEKAKLMKTIALQSTELRTKELALNQANKLRSDLETELTSTKQRADQLSAELETKSTTFADYQRKAEQWKRDLNIVKQKKAEVIQDQSEYWRLKKQLQSSNDKLKDLESKFQVAAKRCQELEAPQKSACEVCASRPEHDGICSHTRICCQCNQPFKLSTLSNSES